MATKNVLVSVSTDGFTWTPSGIINVFERDTIEFQPSGPNAPTLVTVTLRDDGKEAAAEKEPLSPAALFGVPSCAVPSQQAVKTDHGFFCLTAGDYTAIVCVSGGGRPITPNPPPDPRGRM